MPWQYIALAAVMLALIITWRAYKWFSEKKPLDEPKDEAPMPPDVVAENKRHPAAPPKPHSTGHGTRRK